MLKVENTFVTGWEPAIRGMRNPLNSWKKSDTAYPLHTVYGSSAVPDIGEADMRLMKNLIAEGAPNRKFLRFIVVYCDIIAPSGLWWPEFDTYKVGTVRNSCSKMHKIHSRDLKREDFSIDNLEEEDLALLDQMISDINNNRRLYLETKDKRYWRKMLELLPISYNQRATVMLNYEVLRGMYFWRHNHKLQEWRDFCKWIEMLPYAKELIIGEVNDNVSND